MVNGNFSRFATIFVTALYAMLATMFILVMLVHECWLISLGMTGHEWRSLSVKVCCGLGSSRPYSKGLFRNWLDFFSGNIYIYKEFLNDYNILGFLWLQKKIEMEIHPIMLSFLTAFIFYKIFSWMFSKCSHDHTFLSVLKELFITVMAVLFNLQKNINGLCIF